MLLPLLQYYLMKLFCTSSNCNVLIVFISFIFSSEDAVCIGKVRCTFWSLGESLKPDGFVNPFVISAFCYGLYLNPSGNPDVSKSHYFFANIGVSIHLIFCFINVISMNFSCILVSFYILVQENLMKERDQANEDVIARAFKRYN